MASSNLHSSATEVVDARVGTEIRGKWRVDSLIGTGGMAAVYAATHRNGNRVALKVLHVQLSIDKNLQSRFKREGYVANTVNHPGVVRVLDDDETEDGAAFLVMELLEGETTAMRADRLGGRLPLQDVLAVMDGLLDVLSAAHAAGIVHRDVKPENIFFTKDRVVKILDFGIARLHDAANKSGVGHTMAGMGTPAFMPPEQALGRMGEVDALSDVWSAGATAYTLISGALVHDLDTPNEVLVAAATRPAGSLAIVAPETPPEIVEVVDRALAFDKKQRWSSARAMQHALRQAAHVLSSPGYDSGQRLAAGPGSGPVDIVGAPDRISAPEESLRETLPGPEPSSPANIANITGAHVPPPAAQPSSRGRYLVLGLLAAVVAVGVGVFAIRRAPPVGVATANAPTPVTTAPTPPSATAAPDSASAAASADAPAPTVDIELPATHAPRSTPTAPAHGRSWLDRRK